MSGGRSSSIVSTPKSVTATHKLLQAGRAHHFLVLAVLQHRSERAVHGRSVELLDAGRFRAASQSIDSAIPGGFCTSLFRIRETAFAT